MTSINAGGSTSNDIFGKRTGSTFTHFLSSYCWCGAPESVGVEEEEDDSTTDVREICLV